jgi:hypothetical protein
MSHRRARRAAMSRRLKQVLAAKRKAKEARSKAAIKAAAVRKPKLAAKATA